MPLYLEKIRNKIDSIKEKNLSEIVSQNTYIPFLGNSYTESELQNWLQEKIDHLENIVINKYNDNQIQLNINSLYGSLLPADKIIADNILAHRGYDLSTASSKTAYSKLILLVLYRFATSEN